MTVGRLTPRKRKIRAYCALHDLELVEIIVDAGESGKSLDRPGVQRVLDMVRRRQVDAVVVVKLDRLCRCTLDAEQVMKQFQTQHVAFCSISETSIPLHHRGSFSLVITAAYAEWNVP